MSAWTKLGGLFKKGGKYLKDNPDKVEEAVKASVEIYNDVKKKNKKDEKKK